MGNKFASAKRAIAICDRCGFQYKLKKLKALIIKSKNTHLMVCPECWEKDHPQNKLGEVVVTDPQAIRNPRPDNATAASRVTQYGFRPVGGGNNIDIPNTLVGNTKIGTVTVTT